MSQTSAYGFPKNGPCERIAEYGNAWGSAPRIWSPLAKRHMGNEIAYITNSDQFWLLANDPRLTTTERNVLVLTYDYALVAADHFEEMAGFIRIFDVVHPAPPNNANHLPAMAKLLEDAIGKWFAVGFHWTSISSNPWIRHNYETDEFRHYDLSVDENHWFVHDALNKELLGASS